MNDDNSVRMSIERDDEMFIRVIAPKTLLEGFSFDVLVDGEPFTVHVPRGGVKEGQEFDVLYDRGPRYFEDPEEGEEEEEDSTIIKDGDTLPALGTQTMSHSSDHDDGEIVGERDAKTHTTWYDEATGAPIGRWRTKLCRCCDVVTQSTFWMACCCTPVLIAQLIHRFNLTWNGQTGDITETQLSYNRVIIGLIVALGFWKIPGLGDLILMAYWIFIVVYVGAQVRAYVRQKYKIPATLPSRFGKRMDDCCCMMFCGCCSAIQMARHTHDDKEFPGHACTTTALGFDAPPVVETV